MPSPLEGENGERETGSKGREGITNEMRVVCLRRWLSPAQWWQFQGLETVNNLPSRLKEHTHPAHSSPVLLIQADFLFVSLHTHTHAQTKAILV